MQTLVQVVCSKGKSLRDVIVNDPKLPEFGLVTQKKQQPSRQHGWAKIRSSVLRTGSDEAKAADLRKALDPRYALGRNVPPPRWRVGHSISCARVTWKASKVIVGHEDARD
jgi:hypothetical protein